MVEHVRHRSEHPAFRQPAAFRWDRREALHVLFRGQDLREASRHHRRRKLWIGRKGPHEPDPEAQVDTPPPPNLALSDRAHSSSALAQCDWGAKRVRV